MVQVLTDIAAILAECLSDGCSRCGAGDALEGSTFPGCEILAKALGPILDVLVKCGVQRRVEVRAVELITAKVIHAARHLDEVFTISCEVTRHHYGGTASGRNNVSEHLATEAKFLRGVFQEPFAHKFGAGFLKTTRENEVKHELCALLCSGTGCGRDRHILCTAHLGGSEVLQRIENGFLAIGKTAFNGGSNG